MCLKGAADQEVDVDVSRVDLEKVDYRLQVA
jgi:hypothetical protein